MRSLPFELNVFVDESSETEGSNRVTPTGQEHQAQTEKNSEHGEGPR